jgi:hypothetical protein
MGRKLGYGTIALGLTLTALLAVPFAVSGTATARSGHPAPVARPGGHATVTRRGDPTLGRASTLGAPPRGASPTVAAPALKICSFSAARSRAPFATATGTLGYGQMRSDLLNPANFGPSGKVHRTIVIAAGVKRITKAGLRGCNVFFTSVFTGRLSATERSALKAAFKRGLRVITDADSDTPEANAVNSVLTALGFRAAFDGNIACLNDANGGHVRSAGPGDPAVYGPFGDLRGDTWGTSLSNVLRRYRAMTRCGTAVVRSIKHRRVLVGGDPSGFDLFTSPSGPLFNPANEAAYLNFIGAAH